MPVLVEPGGERICGILALRAYLEEIHRLVAWFDEKFNAKVTQPLSDERIMKQFLGLGAPDSRAVRAAKTNIRNHLDYIDYLAERRRWLAGDVPTLADFAAAAHLSCADYMGDVPWEDYGEARNWFARMKSRPSFRALLGDNIPGCPPPKHYTNLDF